MNSNEENSIDCILFSTTLVPLKLDYGNSPVWINPFPSSNLFCRPNKHYIKESTEVVVEERKNVQDQINKLNN